MSKYGNIKTRTSDGILHDSIRDANRWCELNLLLKAGKIQDLQRQVKFELIPKQDGERAVYYVADYVYKDLDGKVHVEDVKGYKDGGAYRVFVIKRKLMKQIYGIAIEEV